MSEFEQIVRVSGAFDKRNPDPSKDYGIGACRITFILKGPKGAVQFMIGTNWYLPDTQRRLRADQYRQWARFDTIEPSGWDVGYHSPEPMYEDQDSMKCDLIEAGRCYYDGSGLRADEWVPKFIEGGTDWLWQELEAEYRCRFEEEDAA